MLVSGKAETGNTRLPLRQLCTVLKVPLTVLPNEVTIEIAPTIMSASITAYSTAVGPS